MARLLDTVRSEDWLTADRMRLWAVAVLIASAAGLAYLVATSNGLIDYQGRPLGTDFASFYAAGTLVLESKTHDVYDGAAHFMRQQALFGPDTPYYAWLYPPFFLFIAGALAWLPYLAALLVWQGGTFALYLVAMRAVIRSTASGIDRDRLWLLLAVAYPAVLINIGHGQNGLLTASLFAGALATLNQRPVLAGILFGLLIYKPQFGILIPVALLAAGRWRTIAAAAATVAAAGLAATLAFGLDIWRDFIASSAVARVALMESGEVGWHKVQSVLAWVRMWGAPAQMGYAIHGAVALGVAAAVFWLWRSAASYPVKAAGLAVASIVAAFHSHDYDLMVLAPAVAFLTADGLSRGFLRYEKTILAVVWITPLITRSLALATLIPLGTIATLVLFALVMRRAAAWSATDPLLPRPLTTQQASSP